MSELLKKLHKRNLRRKAKKFYRAMKETLEMEKMLWDQISDIDRRGDSIVVGEYQLKDGFGFRLLNEDEVLTGEPFPIHPICIANIAKKRPVVHNTRLQGRCSRRYGRLQNRRPPYLLRTTGNQYELPNDFRINMPLTANFTARNQTGEQSTLDNFVIFVVSFSLLALVFYLLTQTASLFSHQF